MDSAKKGQSAIEYLMTYGWMLLVVAIIGGAIFSVVQGQNVESTSGFTGSDVQVNDFALTSNGSFDISFQNADSEPIKVKNITVSDGQDTLEWEGSANIPVTDTNIVSLENISETDSTNSLDVTVTYDRGNLPDIQTSGQITGNFEVGTTSETTETTGETTNPPSVETLSTTTVNKFNATVNGNITNTGGEIPEARFNYGKDQNNLINTTELGKQDSSFNTTLKGLESNTTYYFQAEANNSEGSDTGDINNFTTESTTTLIDSFEDGDISEYTGETGGWSVNSGSAALEGSNYAKGDNGGGYSSKVITRTADISVGDNFRAYMRPQSESNNGVTNFAFQFFGASSGTNIFSKSSQFVTYHDQDGGWFIGERDSSGNVNKEQASTASKTLKQWYEININSENSTAFTASIYEVDGDRNRTSTVFSQTFTGNADVSGNENFGFQTNSVTSSGGTVIIYVDSLESDE